MAWDSTQPTNVTKIRNLGVVIRPNWQAIEQADATFQPQALNFKDRTVAGLPVNPTAIANTFISFCKEASAGNSELYGIDENSNVIQFSASGRIGGPLQNFNLNNFRFNTRAQDYTINNIVHAYGRFNGDGTTVIAHNCTISRIATGIYRVTLSLATTNTLYVPVAVCLDDGPSERIAYIGVQSTTQFYVRITNGGGSDRDCGGFFHVVGGF